MSQQSSEEVAKRPLRSGISAVLVGLCGVVVVCSLAVSTRPNEFKAYSGFISREDASMGERVFLSGLRSHRARQLVLRGMEGSPRLAEAVNENKPLTSEEVDAKAKEWAENHPEESQRIFLTTVTGIIIGCLGLVFLLTSEIHTVLLVRDLDQNVASGEPMTAELQDREVLWGGGLNAKWRPWLSLSGLILMIVSGLVMFYPMCTVLQDFGMPEAVSTADCTTSVILISFVGAIGWACLLTSLCWMCTRPWASLLLASISLGAHVTTGIASPILVLIWALTSGFLCYWYLQWVPESQQGYHAPDWTGQMPRRHQSGSDGHTTAYV